MRDRVSGEPVVMCDDFLYIVCTCMGIGWVFQQMPLALKS